MDGEVSSHRRTWQAATGKYIQVMLDMTAVIHGLFWDSAKSAVIVHSTPNAGVQISGTPTPSGSYSSQAITLAQKYMSRYAGYTKYDYHTSSGNYIRRGNYFRWNRSTLSDPDGYLNMTADQILADLFN